MKLSQVSKGVKGRGVETTFYADISTKTLPWENAKGVWGAEKENSGME